MSGTEVAVTVTSGRSRQTSAGRRRRLWAGVRVLLGAGILALLVWRLGTGPFVDGIRTIDAWSLGAAFVIGVLTTVCCAWRWHLVSRGLGVAVPIRSAVPAYYRSLFLNTTLPGGVVGDVHRAVLHGRDAGDVGAGMRAVAWERSAGQVVQIALTVMVLLVLPSPVRGAVPLVAAGIVALALFCVLASRTLPRSGPAIWVRTLETAGRDLRRGVFDQRAWPGIVLASVVIVAGHAATFLLAARTAGLSASTMQLLPIALLVLMAMAIPLSIGGWGPREGVAAWAFAMAGLGAAQGVATAVVYGVLALVATLPGAVVLVAAWLHRDPTPVRGAARA